MFNQSAYVFIFGEFHIHHKYWLTYSGGIERVWELCYNFFMSNDLIYMVHFPTLIPDCDSHSPALLDLFISSNTSICSTMAFLPSGNSDHVIVSVSIDFPKNSKQDAPFYHIAYDYSCAAWDGFHITWEMFHERISLNSVLLLLLVNFVSGFGLELMHISLTEISGQASLIFVVFSGLCCCHIS